MQRFAIFLSILLLTALAAPVFAGTVYVPLVIDDEIEGNAFKTEIRFTNDNDAARRFSAVFIPSFTDGTDVPREGLGLVERAIQPRATLRLDDLGLPGQSGILEIEADEDIAVTARLVSSNADSQLLGTEMPVVSSGNLVPAGGTGIIQGINRVDGVITTDLYLMNIGTESSECMVEVYKRGGTLLVAQNLTILPLSLIPFNDVLRLLGESGAADVYVASTCDQPTHPFAVVRKTGTAETLYLAPSYTGADGVDNGSGRGGGGGGGGGGVPSTNCPANAALNVPGLAHRPVVGLERKRFEVPTGDNQIFSQIVIDLQLTVGGWNRRSADNHNIFWFQRTDTWRGNVFGYLNAFGPNRNRVKNITNVDLAPGDVAPFEVEFVLQPGKTYDIRYIFDTDRAIIETTFTDPATDQIVFRMVGSPTVGTIRSKAPGFFIAFGHGADEHGPEVPTYGWQYKDICVQLIP